MELVSYLSGSDILTVTAATLREGFDAVRVAPHFDAAILDINLDDALVFPLADELARLGIPFLFATGYSSDVVPPRFADRVFLEKPIDMGSSQLPFRLAKSRPTNPETRT